MTAEFADHKSLAFAYADLVDAGFAEDRMRADFGTPPDAASLPAAHVGLLQRLQALAARMRAKAAAPRHAPHALASANLHFEEGDRAAEAAAIVTRHGGVVLP